MRNKILYVLIAIFGATALVSGYIWRSEISGQRLVVRETPIVSEPTTKETNEKIINLPNYQSYSTKTLNKDESPITNHPPAQKNDSTTSSKSTITSTTPLEKKIDPHITLEIDGYSLSIPYLGNMTAEDGMKKAHELYPESFWYQGIEYGGDMGTFVKSINSKSENYQEKMHWILYLNGKKSNKGISTLKLNQNDIIKWSYEKEIL